MRYSELYRKTKETEISVKISIDGDGKTAIDTGVGFFNHMLEAMAFHAKFDLTVTAKGDLHVDAHHTVEDTGILLGRALANALADEPIARYGHAFVPMDEALAFCALDIGGRTFLSFDDGGLSQKTSNNFDISLINEFFAALSRSAFMTLHMKIEYGNNAHHMAEASFKALGRALSAAVKPSHIIESSKGMLDG